MTQTAIADKQVTFSAGLYGRPLLHARDAGRAVVLLAEERHARMSASLPVFEVVLLPGHFTPFETFADIVIQEVQDEKGTDVTKIAQASATPDWLKTTCVSQRLKDAGFAPNQALIVEGLRETAKNAISSSISP